MKYIAKYWFFKYNLVHYRFTFRKFSKNFNITFTNFVFNIAVRKIQANLELHLNNSKAIAFELNYFCRASKSIRHSINANLFL